MKFNFRFWVFLVFSFVVMTSFVFGAKGEISLVTVGETADGVKVGGVADISLEVKPGSGKVFIDSFPFTREDTQVSVRFAKDVACNFLEIDCSRLDFFYSIRIGSSSVGGPSAGAAIAVLTTSILSNDDLNDNIVISGTINSGGIIGPVSGLEEKAEAARNAGFDKFLVPKRSILSDKTFSNISEDEISPDEFNRSNITIFYADSLVVDGIDIVPVSTLEEALYEFTGTVYPDYSYEIEVPDTYQRIMSDVAHNLCERSVSILNNISGSVLEDEEFVVGSANESIMLGREAIESEDYYSAASFCFTANSALRELEYSYYDNDFLSGVAENLSLEINMFLDDLKSRDLKTMSDLETYIIVKERLFEANSLLEENNSLNNLGYIVERFYSAVAWSSFFEFEGKSVVLDDEHLANACVSKISEAEERLSYIDFLTGRILDRSELEDVQKIYEDGNYAFCIFSAAKIKADANAIILSMSLTKDMVEDLINDQLMFARMQINKQKDNFPILGYSYYNYATSLKNSRPELSTVFAEYASEFSNLDMYFPSERRVPVFLFLDFSVSFFVGVFFGIVVCGFVLFFFIFIYNMKPKKKRLRRKKKK